MPVAAGTDSHVIIGRRPLAHERWTAFALKSWSKPWKKPTMFVALPTALDTWSYSDQLNGDCAVYRPYQRDCWPRISALVGVWIGAGPIGSVEGPGFGFVTGPPDPEPPPEPPEPEPAPEPPDAPEPAPEPLPLSEPLPDPVVPEPTTCASRPDPPAADAPPERPWAAPSSDCSDAICALSWVIWSPRSPACAEEDSSLPSSDQICCCAASSFVCSSAAETAFFFGGVTPRAWWTAVETGPAGDTHTV